MRNQFKLWKQKYYVFMLLITYYDYNKLYYYLLQYPLHVTPVNDVSFLYFLANLAALFFASSLVDASKFPVAKSYTFISLSEHFLCIAY